MLTGTHIHYYLVCKRKLWLFARGLEMEHTSDTVLLGRLIDQSSYQRKDKGIDIDGTIVIDWIDERQGILHEVKKSDSIEEAHRWQMLYYLWFLRRKGVAHLKGEIDYPKLKQKTEVVLTTDLETQIESLVAAARELIVQPRPPVRMKKGFCKTCSYYELCWSTV